MEWQSRRHNGCRLLICNPCGTGSTPVWPNGYIMVLNFDTDYETLPKFLLKKIQNIAKY